MSTEDNKAIARRLVCGLASPSVDSIGAVLHRDASWTVMAHPDSFPVNGTMTRAEFLAHIAAFHRLLPDGIDIEITGITAEGDRVAVEAKSHAILQNGRSLNQVYHFLLEIRENAVVNVREYIDTAHGLAVMS